MRKYHQYGIPTDQKGDDETFVEVGRQIQILFQSI